MFSKIILKNYLKKVQSFFLVNVIIAADLAWFPFNIFECDKISDGIKKYRIPHALARKRCTESNNPGYYLKR